MLWIPTVSIYKPSTFRLFAVSSLVLSFAESNHRRKMTTATTSGPLHGTDVSNASPFENPSRNEWLPIPHHPSSGFDWELSTEENFRSETHELCGHFKAIRERLDYNYHGHYSCARQRLQDFIIHSILAAAENESIKNRHCRVSPNPWVVFTAGVMGAGKSFTIRRLHEKGLFPLDTFVVVDPDEIRRLLPEFQIYLRTSAENAGALTRKEAGMMAEILSEAALERGQNVLKDGSLRDADWYKNYFNELRHSFPGIRLGIIHVTAPLGVILERVQERAKQTGRIVPRAVIETSVKQVPISVEILKNHVDFFLEIDNATQDDGASVIVARGSSVSSVKEKFVLECDDAESGCDVNNL